MGILDSLRKFADKKKEEYRETEKANAETRVKENAVYKESFAQARLKQLKVKARTDAKASVLSSRGGGDVFSRINNSGLLGYAPPASKKGQGGGKAHKTVSIQSRMINPDSIDYNNIGAASLFNKKNRYLP